MPNWVEGKLKIRGKPEDIKRWVEECLHCYRFPASAEPQPDGRYAGNQRGYHDRKGGLQRLRLCIQN